jgi:hypothetical protein
MTEDFITREMFEISQAIRDIKGKKKRTKSDDMDIASMEKRHADLAKKLQQIQRDELKTKNIQPKEEKPHDWFV